MLAWYGHGYADKHQAEVVNYADDFVLLCREGQGAGAMAAMRHLMCKLGLTVNEKKNEIGEAAGRNLRLPWLYGRAFLWRAWPPILGYTSVKEGH
jgi:hypothetical protein